MPSGKSYFNLALFRKNLARFWPIWGGYLIIWLMLPLNILNNGWEPQDPLDTLQLGLVLVFIFSILAAMAVFSYLYSSKSAHLMHSLPVRREGLFLTNYLSGLSFLLLPQLATFLLTLLVGGYNFPPSLLLWLLAQFLMSLFFYSFAVFCAMFTGNLLALPIFYGILNFLAGGLYFIITNLLREFLFGFSGGNGLDELVAWLTPFVRLAADLGYYWPSGSLPLILTGLPALLLYGLIGILLAVAALFIYRRRRLETAGDLVSVRWVRPVFKYGVAFCAAVSIGSWFYNQFRDLFPIGHWSFLIPLLLWGALGYFAADMLLKKSFKVFAKAWRGILCFSLIMIAAFTVTDLDLFGFNNAPAKSAVASVRVYGISSAPYDSGNHVDFTVSDGESIDAVLALHSAIAARKNTIRQELVIAEDTGSYSTDYLYLTYTLTDGRIIRREYDLPIDMKRLGDSGSIEAALTSLINQPAFVEEAYWGRQNIPEEAKLVDVSLNVYVDAGYLGVSVDSQENRDKLLAAVKADMAAGRIGIRYLTDTTQRLENCYYNDLTFSYYLPAGTVKTDTSTLIPAGSNANTRLAATSESQDWTVTVTLQKTATATLKVLQELGYTDDGQLVTWAEEMRRGDEESKDREAAYAEPTLRAVG